MSENNRNKEEGRRKVSLPAIILTLILLVGGGGGGFLAAKSQLAKPVQPQEEVTENWEIMTNDSAWDGTLSYEGSKWKLNRKLTTILFMGIDAKEGMEFDEVAGSNGRADTILLFVLNNEENTMQILQISRETMVEVDVYNRDREFLYSGPMQITLQYSFGDSHARSCWLMKNKVSELLYNLPMNGYASMTIDGMVKIAEAMGGVTVTFDQDYTDINEAYVKGTTVTMNGEEVERFVRYRDTNVSGSNNTRMDRNAWLVQQLFAQLRTMSGTRIMELFEAAGDDITTDLDGETIVKISRYTLTGDIATLPGEVIEGKYHDEFYVDEEAMKELVIKTFYVKAD